MGGGLLKLACLVTLLSLKQARDRHALDGDDVSKEVRDDDEENRRARFATGSIRGMARSATGDADADPMCRHHRCNCDLHLDYLEVGGRDARSDRGPKATARVAQGEPHFQSCVDAAARRACGHSGKRRIAPRKRPRPPDRTRTKRWSARSDRQPGCARSREQQRPAALYLGRAQRDGRSVRASIGSDAPTPRSGCSASRRDRDGPGTRVLRLELGQRRAHLDPHRDLDGACIRQEPAAAPIPMPCPEVEMIGAQTASIVG